MLSYIYHFPTKIPPLDKINLSASKTSLKPNLFNKIPDIKFFLTSGTLSTSFKVKIFLEVNCSSTDSLPLIVVVEEFPMYKTLPFSHCVNFVNMLLSLHTCLVAPVSIHHALLSCAILISDIIATNFLLLSALEDDFFFKNQHSYLKFPNLPQ
ncbi:hypothetical protein V6Z12_A02G099200 [Gossypium hirsutum]